MKKVLIFFLYITLSFFSFVLMIYYFRLNFFPAGVFAAISFSFYFRDSLVLIFNLKTGFFESGFIFNKFFLLITSVILGLIQSIVLKI